MQTQLRQFENFKVILPPLLAMLFFAIAIFGVAIPALEKNLLHQKKLLLTELVHTVSEILQNYDDQVKRKEISLEEAQKQAKEQIRGLHYYNIKLKSSHCA